MSDIFSICVSPDNFYRAAGETLSKSCPILLSIDILKKSAEIRRNPQKYPSKDPKQYAEMPQQKHSKQYAEIPRQKHSKQNPRWGCASFCLDCFSASYRCMQNSEENRERFETQLPRDTNCLNFSNPNIKIRELYTLVPCLLEFIQVGRIWVI